ncbi:signal peptidase I [Natrinema sp. HArc-T2]|uniref:signal peptidase I n=1 Tax=Natrinema sp. HArc-T2 TaxID=3242701 RepID=UPI00359D191E
MGLNAKSVVYTVSGMLLLAMLVLVAVVTVPGIVGGDDAYIVTSGSMQPTIGPGDVVVTKDVSPDEIGSGDVVTFNADSNTDRGYVTHRVIEVREENGERYFKTKGDANDNPDEGLVPAEYAQGELHWHIPYLGHLLLFARSSLGLFVLVIGPGLALVVSGGYQLLREFGYLTNGEPPELEAADGPPALEPADKEVLKGDNTEGAESGSEIDQEPGDDDTSDTESGT